MTVWHPGAARCSASPIPEPAHATLRQRLDVGKRHAQGFNNTSSVFAERGGCGCCAPSHTRPKRGRKCDPGQRDRRWLAAHEHVLCAGRIDEAKRRPGTDRKRHVGPGNLVVKVAAEVLEAVEAQAWWHRMNRMAVSTPLLWPLDHLHVQPVFRLHAIMNLRHMFGVAEGKGVVDDAGRWCGPGWWAW